MRFSRNLKPIELHAPKASRILVIAPHADDETIGPGGTIIHAVNSGAKVHCLYLTLGQPAEKAEHEVPIVAQEIGYSTEFLGFTSHNIPLSVKAVHSFAKAIQRFKPTCIFLPFLLDDHDDHRRANHLLLSAYQEQLLPENVEMWAYQVYTTLLPNVVVDITDVKDRKIRAIRMWQSKMQSRDWAHYALGLNAFNCRFLESSAAPRYAESFFVLPLAEYIELCKVYFKDPAAVYYFPSYKQEYTG